MTEAPSQVPLRIKHHSARVPLEEQHRRVWSGFLILFQDHAQVRPCYYQGLSTRLKIPGHKSAFVSLSPESFNSDRESGARMQSFYQTSH